MKTIKDAEEKIKWILEKTNTKIHSIDNWSDEEIDINLDSGVIIRINMTEVINTTLLGDFTNIAPRFCIGFVQSFEGTYMEPIEYDFIEDTIKINPYEAVKDALILSEKLKIDSILDYVYSIEEKQQLMEMVNSID